MSEVPASIRKRRGMSRETRLLIVTITVSAVVLLLLSRLRFPERPPTVSTSVPPLERLAARATYDELAAIVAGVERKIAPGLVVLRLAPVGEATARRLDDVLRMPMPDASFRHVPALRIDATTAIAAMEPDVRLAGIVGAEGATPSSSVLATDPVRRLALVRVPPAETELPPEVALTDLRTPTYVVVVEGTRAGLTFRPMFIGSRDRFEDPRWTRPLLAVSSAALAAPGALIFSLEGGFLGGAVVEGGTLAVAGARDIMTVAERLNTGAAAHLVDIGVSVQPLTRALASALGAPHGVVVAAVDPDGPAPGVLQPADVITVMDGRPIDSADDWLVQVAQREPGSSIRLIVMRDRKPVGLTLTLPPPAAPASAPGGLGLRFERGDGSVVTAVAPRSWVEAAGLRAGDLITRAGEVTAPSPEQVTSLRNALAPGSFLVATVQRGGRDRVVAIPAPPAADER